MSLGNERVGERGSKLNGFDSGGSLGSDLRLHKPVEQLLRLGMDGEDLSCCMDDLLTAVAVSEASAADGELCFVQDSES